MITFTRVPPAAPWPPGDRGVKALGEPAVDRRQELRASSRLPCCCHSRVRLSAARNSNALACWPRATARACWKQASAWWTSGLGSWSSKAPWSRYNSASHHRSSVVATSVKASARTRSPASGCPAWPHASAKRPRIIGSEQWYPRVGTPPTPGGSAPHLRQRLPAWPAPSPAGCVHARNGAQIPAHRQGPSTLRHVRAWPPRLGGTGRARWQKLPHTPAWGNTPTCRARASAS